MVCLCSFACISLALVTWKSWKLLVLAAVSSFEQLTEQHFMFACLQSQAEAPMSPICFKCEKYQWQCFTNYVWRSSPSICVSETIMWNIVIRHSNELGNMQLHSAATLSRDPSLKSQFKMFSNYIFWKKHLEWTGNNSIAMLNSILRLLSINVTRASTSTWVPVMYCLIFAENSAWWTPGENANIGIYKCFPAMVETKFGCFLAI